MLVDMTNCNQERQIWLASQLQLQYGHATPAAATEAAREARMAEVKGCVFSSICRALKSLKNTTGGPGGRLNNHRQIVRQVLLTVVSSSLPSKSKTMTAEALGVYARDLSQYRYIEVPFRF